MGHFMRCLALAQEVTRQNWVVYFTGIFSNNARNLLATKLPAAIVVEVNPKSAIFELQAHVQRLVPDVVHLDSYLPELDKFSFENGVLSNSQDGVFGARDAMVNIDANLDAENRSLLPKSGKALFGINYAQIRDEVRRLRHVVQPVRGRHIKVLVVLGGTDPTGATPLLVRALAKSNFKLQLTVVCRESLHDEVKNSVELDGSLLTLQTFADDLPALANNQDFVITTASTSAWDFAAMGVPMGVVCVADNQVEGFSVILSNKLAINFGDYAQGDVLSKTREGMALATDSELLKELSESGRRLVDGRGIERIVRAWEDAIHKSRDNISLLN